MISLILLALSLAGGVFPQPDDYENTPPFFQGENSTPTPWTAPIATYTLASSLGCEHPTPGTWPVVSTSTYTVGDEYGNPGASYSYATTASSFNSAGYLSGSAGSIASVASNASIASSTTTTASVTQTDSTTGDAAQLRSGVCVAMIIAVGVAALY